MKKALPLVVLAMLSLLATTLPSLRRYLKMERM